MATCGAHAAATTAAAFLFHCCRAASACSNKSRATASVNCAPAAKRLSALSKLCSSVGHTPATTGKQHTKGECKKSVPADKAKTMLVKGERIVLPSRKAELLTK